MSTYYEEAVKANPWRAEYVSQPSYALRAMVKALSMMDVFNTAEDWKRLEGARRELAYRAKLRKKFHGGQNE